METKRALKLSPDSGIKRGKFSDLKHATGEAIGIPVEEGQSSKQDREGFSPKNYVTMPSESREVSALRKEAGWKTHGSSAESREDPPTSARDNTRLVTPLKKSKGSYCSDWGAGIDQSNNYL
jgi:hypothetical protein